VKQANIRAYIGGSGTGKTTELIRYLRRERPVRLVVWDPEHEFTAWGYSTARWQDVRELSRAHQFAIVYHPPREREHAEKLFDLVCEITFERVNRLWIEAGRTEAERMTLVVDELADVVRAGYSPPQWAACVRLGRKRGLSILAASQRPAVIDKTFWSLATYVRGSALGYAEDQSALAKALGVPVQRVAMLRGYEAIERDSNALSPPYDRTTSD